LDRGHELDGGGARADHRDALAAELVVVVPLRGVKRGAREGVEAGKVRIFGLAERAARVDEEVGGEGALRGLDLPAAGRFVPARLGHLVTEADVAANPVLLRAALEVAEDLRLRGKAALPRRLRSKE